MKINKNNKILLIAGLGVLSWSMSSNGASRAKCGCNDTKVKDTLKDVLAMYSATDEINDENDSDRDYIYDQEDKQQESPSERALDDSVFLQQELSSERSEYSSSTDYTSSDDE